MPIGRMSWRLNCQACFATLLVFLGLSEEGIMCFIIQLPILLDNDLDTIVLAKVVDRVWLVNTHIYQGTFFMMSIHVIGD
jgi:hypothetical protein